jgi:hypothetical protein
MRFELCKEKQHSQNMIFLGYGVAEAPPGF